MNEKQDNKTIATPLATNRSQKGRPRSKKAEAEALRRNLLRRKAAAKSQRSQATEAKE